MLFDFRLGWLTCFLNCLGFECAGGRHKKTSSGDVKRSTTAAKIKPSISTPPASASSSLADAGAAADKANLDKLGNCCRATSVESFVPVGDTFYKSAGAGFYKCSVVTIVYHFFLVISMLDT